MSIFERIRALPQAIAHTYRAWREFWWLAQGYRNPDEAGF